MTQATEPSAGTMSPRGAATGYALYLIAATLFAINGIVAKSIMLTGVDAARLSQLRVTAAFVVLLVFFAITRPSVLRLRRSEIGLLLGYGIAGLAMTQWAYFVSLQTLPVGIALLIEFTAPIMVALWFRFGMRQPTRNAVWLALVIALAGLALVAQIWQGFTLSPRGVVFAFGAAVALAVFYVLGDRQMRQPNPRDPGSLTMWAFGAVAAFWAIVQPWWSFPWGSFAQDGAAIGAAGFTVPVWGLATCMVILGTVIPFWLVLASLTRIRASQASVVGMTEPLIAIVIAWVALGESMTAIQIAGALLVLAGVLTAERSR
ncbi:MAG: EamA family transporter [Actinomycetales bacterium]|nr:EamA family transporter [Actinomycetales bacterium]